MTESEVFDDSLKETLASLSALPGKIEAHIVRGALRYASKPIFEAAKQNAPVGQTGNLEESIRISSSIEKKSGTITLQVKAGGGTKKTKSAFYAYMVEFGTKPHGKHPGTPPNGFMRRAFDSGGAQFVALYAEYMRKRIPKELAKRGLG